MQIQILGALALLVLSTNAFAEGKFCEKPDYLVRAPASLPSFNLDGLLTRQEKEKAGTLEELFKKPGPFGHSELGFRHLARVFGYQGDFAKPGEVDLWILKREATNSQFKGSYNLWKKWVREPENALKPRHPEPEFTSFFAQPKDAVEFSSCLSTELSRLRCENYIGRAIEPNSRVYYGNEKSRSPCSIHYMGGKLSKEVPDTMEVSATRTYTDDNGYVVTEKKAWKFDYRAYTAGSAKSATGLEQGTQGAPTAK